MTDVFSKAKRSEVMSRIRGRGNASTEMRLVGLFREHGITGWRRHVRITFSDPEGPKEDGRRRTGKVKPDFVFPKAKVAVFVDGCFWHGCPRHATQPKNNAEFWRDKIKANQLRDRRVTRLLRSRGWGVCRIWECRLKKQSDAVIRRIERMLAGGSTR